MTITEHPLISGLRTGISFSALMPGLVPEIEEREACVFAGYNWREWADLGRADRVDAVAHYRLHYLIERHGADAGYQDSKARLARANARSNEPGPPRRS